MPDTTARTPEASGRLIAVVGPSGVGKDTVIAALKARRPSLHVVRRAITRPPEAGGEVFDPVSDAEFEARRAAGAFLLSWSAHGLHYGIPRGVLDVLAEGRDALANLSRHVLAEAGARVPALVVLALTARDDVLAARLAGRGRESPAEIGARLRRAAPELPEGVPVIEIDNSGPLEATVDAALARLYPDARP